MWCGCGMCVVCVCVCVCVCVWSVCVGGRIPLSVSREVTEELIIMKREVANSVCVCKRYSQYNNNKILSRFYRLLCLTSR